MKCRADNPTARASYRDQVFDGTPVLCTFSIFGPEAFFAAALRAAPWAAGALGFDAMAPVEGAAGVEVAGGAGSAVCTAGGGAGGAGSAAAAGCFAAATDFAGSLPPLNAAIVTPSTRRAAAPASAKYTCFFFEPCVANGFSSSISRPKSGADLGVERRSVVNAGGGALASGSGAGGATEASL